MVYAAQVGSRQKESVRGKGRKEPASGAFPEVVKPLVAADSTHRGQRRRWHGVRSGKALASLILGIGSFIGLIFAAIPAVICGIATIKDIRRSRSRLHGTGMAVTGIVLGSAVSGVMLLGGLLLLLPRVERVREAGPLLKCRFRLKDMALAMHNYLDTHGRLPPAVVRDKNGAPLYSWRVLLLPYLEEDGLYKQFKLDEPWDSQNNIKLLNRMPRCFAEPAEKEPNTSATYYQVFVGPKTMFENPRGEELAAIAEGGSNTILIVEAATAVPWTKPEDLAFDPNKPLPKLSGRHPKGINVAYADGSTDTIPYPTDERTLRALITRDRATKVAPP
jgi:prepilin-type processing-associated H-X9-DG protein